MAAKSGFSFFTTNFYENELKWLKYEVEGKAFKAIKCIVFKWQWILFFGFIWVLQTNQGASAVIRLINGVGELSNKSVVL